MNTHCRIKYRNWDGQKGLEESVSEVMSLDELFLELVDGGKKNSIHSIILDGLNQTGETTKVILHVETITHE